MHGKPLPHTKQTATSADLEWGSDSLSRVYKAMTPGQENAGIFFPKEDIIKTGNQYKLVSKSGGKNLGTYDTKAAAKKRERQVQYFKQQEQAMSIPTFREYLRESNDATPPLVTDVPPPEMESWMRKNKASYVKQHGEETGMVRLTAAAWDIHNREKADRDSSMEPTT